MVGAQDSLPMALTEIKGFIILAQMRQYLAVSPLKAVEQKYKNRIDSETLILAD